MKLLIAIPVHNEQKYLDKVLDKVLRFHPNVLAIDDGSTDGTTQRLEARKDIRLIRHATNLGYGQSLIDAFAYADRAGFDWVITMDCDEQHEPEMIPQFIREIRTDRWDLISGSRYLSPRDNDDLPPTDRRRINQILTEMVNNVLRMDLTDTFCGFKAHRVSAMRRIHLDVPGYAFPMQLWPQVAAAGLRVTEIPVRLIYNDPNRYFGGNLDDADRRLRHYMDVFNAELGRLPQLADAKSPEVVEDAAADCCCN